MPSTRFATQEELADIDHAITDAKSKSKPIEHRVAIGAELNGKLRYLHSTPAVVDLRKRLYADLLDVDVERLGSPDQLQVTHPPEPWQPSQEPPEQHVVLLYTYDDDEDEAFPSHAYLVEGDIDEANRQGAALCDLRGCEFGALKVEALPAVLQAEDLLTQVRAALESSIFETDVVVKIREILDQPMPERPAPDVDTLAHKGSVAIVIDGSGSMQKVLGKLPAAVKEQLARYPGAKVFYQSRSDEVAEALDPNATDWSRVLPFGGMPPEFMQQMERDMKYDHVILITDDDGPQRQAALPFNWTPVILG